MKYEIKDEKVVLSDFDPGEALRLAVYIEEEGAKFYDELMKRAQGKVIRNELGFLKKEETDHSKRFEKLYKKWCKCSMEELKEDALAFLAKGGIFGPIRKIHAEEILCDNAEALKLGATVKKRMIAFFNALLENADDAEVKKTLRKIIDEEKGHLDKLKILMAY
jgi:rubrerythrin